MVNRRGPKRASSGGAKAQPHVKNGEAEQQRRRRKKINNRMNKKYTGDIEFVPKDTDNSVPVIDAMAGFSESDDDFDHVVDLDEFEDEDEAEEFDEEFDEEEIKKKLEEKLRKRNAKEGIMEEDGIEEEIITPKAAELLLEEESEEEESSVVVTQEKVEEVEAMETENMSEKNGKAKGRKANKASKINNRKEEEKSEEEVEEIEDGDADASSEESVEIEAGDDSRGAAAAAGSSESHRQSGPLDSFAKKMSQLLGTEKAEGADDEVSEDPILLKKRKEREVQDAEEEEAKRLSRLINRKKKELKERDYKKPRIEEQSKERQLSKVATRGVVKLFNAVAKAQATSSEGKKKARSKRREQETAKKAKENFFDVLRKNRGEAKEKEKDEAAVAREKAGNTWSVLKDDMMEGTGKMKEWDKGGSKGVDEDLSDF